VGIATGGQFVAAKLLQRIAIQNYMIVKRQRSGTKTKEKSRTLKYIINSIPGPVQNIMRRSEIYIREKLARSRYSENPISNLSIIQSPSKHILESCKSVLIVDDAVDSGNTLSQVKEYVHCIIPLAIIKTAAITSTFEKPVIFPDYVLHRRTIVKFPWSTDAQN
jgi:hypoxanthine phosphoribosyltransferase